MPHFLSYFSFILLLALPGEKGGKAAGKRPANPAFRQIISCSDSLDKFPVSGIEGRLVGRWRYSRTVGSTDAFVFNWGMEVEFYPDHTLRYREGGVSVQSRWQVLRDPVRNSWRFRTEMELPVLDVIHFYICGSEMALWFGGDTDYIDVLEKQP